MRRDTRLRAYLAPPWRAEEFLFWQGYSESFGTVAITINGNAGVPDGYRGVITECDLLVARYTEVGRDGITGDVTLGVVFDLLRDGVVVPGWKRRPCWWATSYSDNDAGLTTATNVNGWFEPRTEDRIDSRFPLQVPIKLRANQRLTAVTSNPGVVTAIAGLRVQGYVWPAADEDERAEGSGADPWSM